MNKKQQEGFSVEIILRHAIKDLRSHIKALENNNNSSQNSSQAIKSKIMFLRLALNELDKFCSMSLFIQGISENDIKNINQQSYRENFKKEEIQEDYINTKNAFLGSVVDGLATSTRKLTEAAVDLIGFSNVDNDDYYSHYVLVMTLFGLNDRINDSERYYGVDKKFGIHDVAKNVAQKEIDNMDLDFEKVWYAKVTKKDNTKTNKYELFSFSKKFIKVHTFMTENQRLLLKSPHYIMGHSNMHLHYMGCVECAYLDLEKINKDLIEVQYSICFYIVSMVAGILGIKDNENDYVKVCNELLAKSLNIYNKEGKKIKDFILIEDSILTQIIGVKSVAKGVRRYKVKLLANNEEYWVAGQYTRIFWRYDDVKFYAEQQLKYNNGITKISKKEIIDELVIHCREFGYKGMNLTPPPDGDISTKEIRGVLRLKKEFIE